MISNPVINRIYIADKFSDKEKDYDEGCRRSIGDFYRKKKISFDALYKGKQILGENSEALIDFDINNSEQIEELDKVVKILSSTQDYIYIGPIDTSFFSMRGSVSLLHSRF